MSKLEHSQSLHGLPALAGLCSFQEAASEGLGIQECVDRLKRYHYAFNRLWKTGLARLTAEPVYELKMGLSYHAYLCSEQITLLRERVAEMRHPPLGLDKVPDPHLQTYFDEILAAPSAYHWLRGIYENALPCLQESLERHVKETNLLSDAPTVRILRSALIDIEQMLVWGKAAIGSMKLLVGEKEVSACDAWLGELALWLDAAGGLDGVFEPETCSLPSQRYSSTPFQFDRTPQRDERFPDPYNMGVHAEEFLYDPQFSEKDKVLMMYYKRLREIDVPEMMATILFDLVTENGDEEDGGKPWGFYRDMTRQLWDEARHAMMGEVGFATLGISWPDCVRVNFTWSKELNEQLTPQERHAVLWYIEQGLMSKTGKRYEWEVGRDSGDPLAMLFQDYDWADEVLHARIGRDWYVKEFETVADASAYGNACWDKVVTGWEKWRREGLTEHYNWWPDLYREACRLRGEDPDPKVAAYNISYAQTRADLERIAASG